MLSKRFQHLADIERKRIVMPDNVQMRLNRLEKPEPWPAELQAKIMWSLEIERLQQYPDYPPFYEKLARFFGLRADEIVVGAGIEEHIRNLFMICTDPGDTVVTLWPSCAMFEIYARTFGVNLSKCWIDPGERPTLGQFVEALPDSFSLLLLPNPGQPVDNCFTVDALEVVAQACRERGAVLAIDEAYHGFGAPTAFGMQNRFDNIVILRTFSKAFGAASIRLGFAVAGPLLKRSLDAVRQSGEVSAFSMHVAGVLMDNFETYVEPGIADIVAGRDMLRERIEAELGLRSWGHFANHVLIDFGSAERKDAVEDALAGRGILVKANFDRPLDRHMLVTCGGPDLMARFLAELRAAP